MSAASDSSCAGAPEAIITEASGIAHNGTSLLIVDDSIKGVYFVATLPPLRPGHPQKGPYEINQAGLSRHKISGAELAFDLESIDILADGRTVVLSERLRSLVGEDGFCVEYDNPLTEFGNIGLEGLAVEYLNTKCSRVAVLWEGGYPKAGDLPEQVRSIDLREQLRSLDLREQLRSLDLPEFRLEEKPLRPVVFVHDLDHDPEKDSKSLKLKNQDALKVIELSVPEPEGEPPSAQRFRATDLVWEK